MNPAAINIAKKLSRYLRSHPDGCDTAEGIARGSIDADEEVVPVALVEAALQWMCECQSMESLKAVDGRVRYRRASGTADLDVKLAAMARDPHSVFPCDAAHQAKKVH
jgi:hypothetical protein